MLRRLEKWSGEEFEGLCAAGRLQCEPADPLVGTLSGRGLSRDAQAAEAGRAGLESLPRGTTKQEARKYLEREWGTSYKNGKEHGWLFKKHRVKWKTGRRRHKKANAEQQAAFKKTLAAC